jgi:tetratricopeptide (TPR) repeat protein
MKCIPRLRDALVAVVTGVLALTSAGCGRRVDPKIKEGYDLVVAGKVDQAIALANELLTKNPKNAAARNVMGLALYKSGDAEGAVQQYRRALQADPKYPEVHFNLGMAYERLAKASPDSTVYRKFMQDAETEYATAVRYQKKFVLAHFNLAVIYADPKSNRTDQAIAELRQCTKYDPQYAPAFVLLGKLLYGIGDFEGAIKNLSRFLELDPAVKEVRVLLGNAYLQSGQPGAVPRAEESFRAAVGVDSTYVDAIYSVAVALATQMKNEEAAKWFRRARALAVGKPDKVAIVQQADEFFARTGLPLAGPTAESAAAPAVPPAADSTAAKG